MLATSAEVRLLLHPSLSPAGRQAAHGQPGLLSPSSKSTHSLLAICKSHKLLRSRKETGLIFLEETTGMVPSFWCHLLRILSCK